MEDALPKVGGEETSLSPEMGNSGPRRRINKLYYFFTNLVPQAQTSLSCHFLTNVLFLGLKGIKAICFGHFFESHISVSSHTYGINICFLFCYLPSVYFIRPSEEPRREQRKSFPPLQFWCPVGGASLAGHYLLCCGN